MDGLAEAKVVERFADYDRLRLDGDRLIERFSHDMEDIFGIEKVSVKLIAGKKVQLEAEEEFTVGSRKPYVDNRLSQVSVFPKIAVYFKQGYKSCAIFPIYSAGKPLATVTALSIMENRFNAELANGLLVGSALLAYYLSGYVEMEKGANLAKYFDAAFDSAVPQMLVDRAGNIVKPNKAFLVAINKNSKEITGENISSVLNLSAESAKKFERGQAEVLVGTTEKRRFNAIQKEVNDNLRHILLLDVTYVKQLDLRASALDYMSGAYAMVLDEDTSVKWASQNIANVLGISNDNLIGVRLNEAAPNWKDVEEAISKSDKHAFMGKVGINLGNGTEIRTTMSVLKNDTGFMCLVYDEGKERYIAMLRSHIDRMIDLSGDMVIITNELGYMKKLNRSAERILGYRTEEIAGKAVSMVYADGDSQSTLTRSLSIARKNMEAGIEEVEFRRKAGEETVPCDAGVSAMLDGDGNFSGYMIVAREKATSIQNIELKAELEKVDKKTEKLKGESELKTQFIYNISHDLKTPITNIKGFSKLLLDGEFGELNESQKEYVKIIYDESERFTKLIQQILDVAKLSAGKMKLDMQEMSFDSLKDNPSIKAMEESCRGKGLDFEWRVEHDVPNVNADPSRLIQVFVNLIGNAIKFTEKGSIRVHIIRKGRSIRVEVTDTGIGISKEDQRKIFKKFYQVQRKGLTMQEGAGTGLGLSIVKEIVDRHGGRVGLESDMGTGSTFWFTIPLYITKRRKKMQRQERDEEVEASASSEQSSEEHRDAESRSSLQFS